jgi:hypothetical protein
MTTQFNFDIESMLEDRVIRVLERVEGLEGLTILPWNDRTYENIYPLILVKAGPAVPLTGTITKMVGNSVTLNITVFTDSASDNDGRNVNHLRGVIRYAMNADNIWTQLSDSGIGFYVYENGVIADESVDLENNNDIQRGQLYTVVCQASEIT